LTASSTVVDETCNRLLKATNKINRPVELMC